MDLSKENPPRAKRPDDKPSPSAELRQIVEDYINDLREIMRKVRNKLN